MCFLAASTCFPPHMGIFLYLGPYNTDKGDASHQSTGASARPVAAQPSDLGVLNCRIDRSTFVIFPAASSSVKEKILLPRLFARLCSPLRRFPRPARGPPAGSPPAARCSSHLRPPPRGTNGCSGHTASVAAFAAAPSQLCAWPVPAFPCTSSSIARRRFKHRSLPVAARLTGTLVAALDASSNTTLHRSSTTLATGRSIPSVLAAWVHELAGAGCSITTQRSSHHHAPVVASPDAGSSTAGRQSEHASLVHCSIATSRL